MEMFEEKQLMAVQSMLRQDILEEKRRIARLCWQLRSVDVVVKEPEPTAQNSSNSSSLSLKAKDEDSEEFFFSRFWLITWFRSHVLGDTRRINDIRELQKAREKKNGLTEIECAVGKEKAAALEDGIQMAGGTMALTGKQKARIE
ncbi:unnamed protein product, partial [Nippostrongylus brasiliensis]|uniref:Uncharacterized protein n=1 Tax=Nippostrongylus brasiliensis TaxID=27835 RepID=A0A0N4XH32_NIPBR